MPESPPEISATLPSKLARTLPERSVAHRRWLEPRFLAGLRLVLLGKRWHGIFACSRLHRGRGGLFYLPVVRGDLALDVALNFDDGFGIAGSSVGQCSSLGLAATYDEEVPELVLGFLQHGAAVI